MLSRSVGRAVTALAGIGVALLQPGHAAYAHGNGPAGSATVACGSGQGGCDLAARMNWQSPPSSGAAGVGSEASGSSVPHCVIDPVGSPTTAPDGTKWLFYRRDCGAGYEQGLFNGPALPNWAPVGQPPTMPAVDPQVVALQAERQLVLPKPVMALSPSGFQVVNVPTWFWLAPASWTPVSSTAQVPGVAVTATATPVSADWDPGDGGSSIHCAGAGTAFVRGDDPSKASPDCGYVYQRGSVSATGGTFTVTATVHWRVGWSGDGQSGVFPDLATTSQVAVQVREVQTLVDGHPGA